MKNRVLSTVLVAGMALGAAGCCGKKVAHQTNARPDIVQVQDTDDNCECPKYPTEIKDSAERQSLDPMLVCAFAETESNFDPHAAAKVCAPGYDATGCFQPGTSADPGYHLAYDEMYVPEDTPGFGAECPQLANDIPSLGQLPRWRWLSFGFMQSLEPPASFWPASHRPDGQDGQYYDVYKRAGISQSADLDAAKACNPTNFNPFTVKDSLCVGTRKMKHMLSAAKFWIMNNKDKLNWDVDTETEKTSLFAAYIAANKYSGLWDAPGTSRVSTAEWPHHPRCDPRVRNGDCWALGFKESWSVSKEYCGTTAAQGDSRCENGKPRREPPAYCYGYTDFMQFVQDCEVPFLPMKKDLGAVKIRAYLRLKQSCR